MNDADHHLNIRLSLDIMINITIDDDQIFKKNMDFLYNIAKLLHQKGKFIRY